MLRRWSNKEVSFIINNYYNKSNKDLSKLLGNRTVKQIQSKAEYMGLKKSKEYISLRNSLINPSTLPISKEKLSDLYWKEGLSQQKISDKINVSRMVIRYWMKKYKIPRRTLSEARMGRRNPFYGKKHSKEKRSIISKKVKEFHRNNPDVLKGKNNPMYGKHHTEETINKISSSLKRRIFSVEHRKKLSLAALGRKRPDLSLMNKDPEFTKKRLKACIKKPNKAELKFIEICKKYNFPYKYTGDGRFLIGNKNPDFIHKEGKKICVEIFGRYWHSPDLNPKIKNRFNSTYEGTIKYYKNYRWKCFIVWEDELDNITESFKINNKLI